MIAQTVINAWSLGGIVLCGVFLWWWVWMADKWDRCVECDRENASCSCPSGLEIDFTAWDDLDDDEREGSA